MHIDYIAQRYQGEFGTAQLINDILKMAIDNDVSDIHIEPHSKHILVRYRLDGLLQTIGQFPITLSNKLTTKFKLMGQLDIAEQRLPQDGRMTITLSEIKRDCRISSCPTINGEKLVLRLLPDTTSYTTLDKLGLQPDQLTLLLNILKKPQGLILVTGPTGSGKTATLYSMLEALNEPSRNIISIEDPVEITLDGINQVSINPRAGLSFAQALRAFLRQDPDVIMVGEIRDQETAEIALKAAQTGHLVLSTLHTNTVAQTLTRLVHMGIPPYLVAQCVQCVISQRLVRTCCPHCHDNDTSLCPHCHDGYLGRTGMFELLPIDKTLQQHLLNHADTATLEAYQQQHWPTWSTIAPDLITQGLTTQVEIERVIPHDKSLLPMAC